jgi:hypothetical protein
MDSESRVLAADIAVGTRPRVPGTGTGAKRGRFLERFERALAFGGLAGVLALLVWIAAPEAVVAIEKVDRPIWLGIVASTLFLGAGVAVKNRWALVLAALVGLPLEIPGWPLGADAAVCERKAKWLAGFLARRPRGYNTPGGHLACGLIAIKIVLKKLCLRAERYDGPLEELSRDKKEARALRDRTCDEAAQALADGDATASELGRRAHALDARMAGLDRKVLARRLGIQDRVVSLFLQKWSAVIERKLVTAEVGERVAEQLRDSSLGGSRALLPAGLVRGPWVFALEFGVFFGRIAIALLLIGSFRASHVVWAVLLFVLELYVVEPVILKFHMAFLNIVLDGPGHPAVDLAKYLDTAVPPDGALHVPIAVPKRSTNPAWSNLSAIIESAARRSNVRVRRVTPFSQRDGNRDTVIELAPETTRDVARMRTDDFRASLDAELARARGTFPIATETRVCEGGVVVSLVDEDPKIWELVGEDANQAFIYLWRNVRALKETIEHLGPKFRPVFVLASNTTDEDVIRYEFDRLAELQSFSDRECEGRVGFLYVLRGGEWLDFDSQRRSFDAADRDFARAVPHFRRALEDPAMPARDWLLRELAGIHDAPNFARVFNAVLREADFHRHFDGFDFTKLPPHLQPRSETLALLERRRAGDSLRAGERIELNRDLLLTVLPIRVSGGFFKKVGNDIALHELLVSGKTRPTVYTDRRLAEHVQDPGVPNYVSAWGDFARYTGLSGTSEEIRANILAGKDVRVDQAPEVGAVVDDKNDFEPGEIEKAVATMLHPANAHVVIGVPRIYVTLPRQRGEPVVSEYIRAVQADRDTHNAADARSRTLVFGASSPAFGKWWHRPLPYLAQFSHGVLNPAHALSHDFQQSYLIAGAAGRLAAFTEALYGPTRFRVRSVVPRGNPGVARALRGSFAVLVVALAVAVWLSLVDGRLMGVG